MLHWRVQDGEVEIVVEANTLSWVGVGWRPAGETKTCRSFPTDAPAPLGSDFHAMDCTDVVVGVAREGRGAVADYYTRDRSTPRRDSFWVIIIMNNFGRRIKKIQVFLISLCLHCSVVLVK